MNPIRYFSMFSGIGGFEFGLQNSKHKFENVGYSEIDKYAISIYEKNYPNHTAFGDATKIRTEELPNFDLLVAGFPCQAFSIAGKRRGFDDTRGTLFFEIARVLKDKRPSYFLFENVKGLLSHNKGETFKTILGVLSDLGYYVQWQIYNSKDYQTAQNRERIFLKGYLAKECGQKVLSVRRDEKKDSAGVSNTDRRIKKVGNFSPSNHYGKNVYGDDGIAPTLVSKSIPKNGLDIMENSNEASKIIKNGSDTSNIIIRRLTPIECERLQGFSDEWTKYGKDDELISDTQRYKCLGNAVTTTVVTAIVDEMFDYV